VTRVARSLAFASFIFACAALPAIGLAARSQPAQPGNAPHQKYFAPAEVQEVTALQLHLVPRSARTDVTGDGDLAFSSCRETTFGGLCIQAFAEEDPCATPKLSTQKAAGTLSETLQPETMGLGMFRIKRTDGLDSNAVGFDVTYVVSEKTITAAYIAKGSELWAQGWLLDVTTTGDPAILIWRKSGGGATCSYTVTGTTTGFTATESVLPERTATEEGNASK
jgi:hypothetical protein